MRNRTLVLCAWTLACALPGAGTPQETTAAFLQNGVGGRALGMGSAFCAVSDDGHAFYWNPAGQSLVERTTVSGMYGPQFGTLDRPLGHFHFVGLTQPLGGDVTLAVNWIRLAVDNIPVYSGLRGGSFLDRLRDRTLRPTGEPEGFLDDAEDAFFFTFSKRNTTRIDLGWMYHKVRVDFPVGLNLKWLRQSLGDFSANGVGVDAGFMMRVHLNDLFQSEKIGWFAAGVHFQDATRTTLRWNTRHQDSAPRNIRFGLACEIPLPLRENAFRLAFDRETRWGGISHFGLEYEGFRVVRLRVGADDGRFTGGAGLRLKSVEVDYPFLSHPFESMHRIGCAVAF